MTPRPLVSIVTPSYNQARFLEAAIRSVLDQDYPAIEHLVIDGGSTDGSVEILRRFSGRLGFWVSEPDHGQSHAINKGWQRARGDIVAYLNADDAYLPGAIRKAVEAFEADPGVGCVYGDAQMIDEDGRAVGQIRALDFDYVEYVRRARTLIPQPSAFIRRSVIERIGWLNESLQFHMDFEYWLRIGRVAALRRLPETLASYRIHTGAKTARLKGAFASEKIAMYEALFGQPDVDPRLRGIRREALANAYADAAEIAFAGLLAKETRRYAARSLRLRPRLPEGELVAKLLLTLGGRPSMAAARAVYQRMTGVVLI